MRYWRTAKEFPRVELPSDLRSATIYSTGRYMMNYGVCFFFLENPPLRPILMQLDLQSVEKIPFSTFAWAFAPEMWGTGLSRLRMSRSFLQDLSRAISRFSRGPVAGNHRQHFFDPTGSNTITSVHRIDKKRFFSIRSGIAIVFDPVGSKKCWRWFSATGPLEKRETALDRSWRKLGLILRRGRPIPNIFGAKAHPNVLKVPFQRTASPSAQ